MEHYIKDLEVQLTSLCESLDAKSKKRISRTHTLVFLILFEAVKSETTAESRNKFVWKLLTCFVSVINLGDLPEAIVSAFLASIGEESFQELIQDLNKFMQNQIPPHKLLDVSSAVGSKNASASRLYGCYMYKALCIFRSPYFKHNFQICFEETFSIQ